MADQRAIDGLRVMIQRKPMNPGLLLKVETPTRPCLGLLPLASRTERSFIKVWYDLVANWNCLMECLVRVGLRTYYGNYNGISDGAWELRSVRLDQRASTCFQSNRIHELMISELTPNSTSELRIKCFSYDGRTSHKNECTDLCAIFPNLFDRATKTGKTSLSRLGPAYYEETVSMPKGAAKEQLIHAPGRLSTLLDSIAEVEPLGALRLKIGPVVPKTEGLLVLRPRPGSVL